MSSFLQRLIVPVAMFFIIISLAVPALAQGPGGIGGMGGPGGGVGGITDQQLGISYGAATGLPSTDVRLTTARIIKVAIGMLGIVALVIILIGGFTWMTAGGSEEKVGEAKKWITAGVIGLAIILSAYSIASFVVSNLVAATTQGYNNYQF